MTSFGDGYCPSVFHETGPLSAFLRTTGPGNAGSSGPKVVMFRWWLSRPVQSNPNLDQWASRFCTLCVFAITGSTWVKSPIPEESQPKCIPSDPHVPIRAETRSAPALRHGFCDGLVNSHHGCDQKSLFRTELWMRWSKINSSASMFILIYGHYTSLWDLWHGQWKTYFATILDYYCPNNFENSQTGGWSVRGPRLCPWKLHLNFQTIKCVFYKFHVICMRRINLTRFWMSMDLKII